MEIVIYNLQGEKTDKKIQLDDSVFGIEPNQHAMYIDTRQYMANRRSGNHSTKERGDIVGSTKKIKRQKGTGTARAGSIKSPLFRGGGRIFGPKPHSYSFRLTKKLKRLARISALSAKCIDNELIVINDIKFDTANTKAFAKILEGLKLQDSKTLFVFGDINESTLLSARNLPKTNVARVEDLNTYQILNNKRIVLCEGSVKKIEEILTK
ncbi:MAG: 50S ribosomal protein L4 [Bacteroidota bacterium]|nr:50S ribosomal protein L4 [Bacteroidota bacterium]